VSAFSLVVDPAWGGQRHGPFSDTIRIGSDPSHCEVVLRADIPLESVHAEIGPTGSSGDLLLSPASRDCGVFIWRNDQAWPLSEPCIVQHGEHFSLISAMGPSLQIQVHASGHAVRTSGTKRESSGDWKLALFLSLAGLVVLAALAMMIKLGNKGTAPPEIEEPEHEPVQGRTSSDRPEVDPGLHWEDLPEGYHRNANRTPDNLPDRTTSISGENNWRSGRISGFQQLEQLRDEKGIRVVINLARDSLELQIDPSRGCAGLEIPCEPIWAAELGLEYVQYHMGARPPNDKRWEHIQQLLREGDTLIHCAYGVDRTGAVAGRWHRCFDEELELSSEEILEYTTSFGGQWNHKGDPNQFLREWMLGEGPCGGAQ